MAGYIQSGSQTYTLTSAPPATCTINQFSISPSSPQTVGVTVQIYILANCTNGVQALRFKIDGTVIQTSPDSSTAAAYWNTTGVSAGNHTITVDVADKVAGYIQSGSQTYTLISTLLLLSSI